MIFLTTYFVQELFPGIIQNLLYYSKTRTSVDEVVYDMEVGELLRDAFVAIIIHWFIPGRDGVRISKWIVNDRMKKILAITRKGLKEKSIEEKILESGARQAGKVKPWTN